MWAKYFFAKGFKKLPKGQKLPNLVTPHGRPSFLKEPSSVSFSFILSLFN